MMTVDFFKSLNHISTLLSVRLIGFHLSSKAIFQNDWSRYHLSDITMFYNAQSAHAC